MMADETEAWSGNAYNAPSLGGGWGKYVGLGLLVLFIELPLTNFGFTSGNPALGLLGLVLIGATIYFPYRAKFFKRKASVSYVLSNKRAMVVMGALENQQILQQCDLNGTTAVVQNYSVKTVSKATNRGTASQGITTEVGDVAFLKNGMKVLTFANVPDPNNVKATADHLIDAARFSSPPPP